MRAKLTAIMIAATVCPAAATTKITDGPTLSLFADVVNQKGFNCPEIVSLIRTDREDERGMPFMVACTGGAAGLYYRVTVQRRGTAIVEIWK